MFIIFSSGLFAQDNKVTGGLYVSPIFGWLKPDSKVVEKDGSRFGFGFGIPIDINFSKNFAFSTGVSFENLGGGLKYIDTIPVFNTVDTDFVNLPKNTVVDYRIQYLEIPLSLKGKTNEIGYLTYFIKAGITPGFRFKAKGDITVNNGKDNDIKDEVKAFNMGYHISGGFEYSLGGSTKLLVEVVFTNGLSNFSKVETRKTAADELRNDKVIVNNLALRLGILF